MILADDDSVTVGSGPTAQHIVARALKTYPVLRPTPADEAAAALVSALRMRLDNATHTAYVHPGAYAEHLRPETILALTRATPPYVRRASGYF